MNLIKLGEKYNRPLVIALGFFDCIHLGHKLLADTACEIARIKSAESALFTFSNDMSALARYDKQIYDFQERAEAIFNLGVENIVYAEFDDEFCSIEPEKFLKLLTENLDVMGIVVGEDYTFGKNAAGDTELLKHFCKKNGIELSVMPFLLADGRKIATRDLKNYVRTGDVARLNSLLSEPYFMLGTVEHARNVGKKLGFPTANITVKERRMPLADGIYATRLYVDGEVYDCMTNVGAKPTFGVSKPSIEAYIFDFNGNLYGKEVKLAFYERTRDVTKFASAEDLINQLKYDENHIRNILKTLE